MRRLCGILVVMCVSWAISVAQSTNATSAPSKEEVLKFMEVLHIKSQLTQYFDGVAKQAKLGAEEGFKEKVPNATPEQLAKIDQFAESLFKGMPVDEMVDAMIPIYQKHLSKEDLDGILAFYASPIGLKLQREQPAMTQESMQVGGEIGRKRIGVMIQQMDAFIAKMAQEPQSAPKQ